MTGTGASMARKILVIGATGLLGNAMFRVLAEGGHDVHGTTRTLEAARHFTLDIGARLVQVANIEDPVELTDLLDRLQPEAVVNCAAIGRPAPADPMRSVAIYAVLPQRLALLCRARGIRLVQIGSDGVFSGAKGNYTESDLPDADDVYGVSKLLGEVSGRGAVTIRTSMIGHELAGGRGLLEWFLSQEGSCRCYSRAIFSGLPTVTLAKITRDVLLPRKELEGVYHIASKPISKYELLRLIAEGYGKTITLVPDDGVVMDRSLSAAKLQASTGYAPPDWPELIEDMRTYRFGLKRG